MRVRLRDSQNELRELREEYEEAQRQLHLESCQRENAEKLLRIEKEARESAQQMVVERPERVTQSFEEASGAVQAPTDSCEDCQEGFTLFRRQYACSYCHGAFCSKCAPRRISFDNQRQCLRCFVSNTESEHKKARIEADTEVLIARYAQADAEMRLKQHAAAAKQAETQQCAVCMDAPRQALMLPCKHLCCCDTCAATLRQRQEQHCPICRCQLSGIMTGVFAQ